MGAKYIESIKFTMSDGTASEQIGRKPFNNTCDFDEKITKVVMTTNDGRLVGIVFDSAQGEYLRI